MCGPTPPTATAAAGPLQAVLSQPHRSCPADGSTALTLLLLPLLLLLPPLLLLLLPPLLLLPLLLLPLLLLLLPPLLSRLWYISTRSGRTLCSVGRGRRRWPRLPLLAPLSLVALWVAAYKVTPWWGQQWGQVLLQVPPLFRTHSMPCGASPVPHL